MRKWTKWWRTTRTRITTQVIPWSLADDRRQKWAFLKLPARELFQKKFGILKATFRWKKMAEISEIMKKTFLWLSVAKSKISVCYLKKFRGCVNWKITSDCIPCQRLWVITVLVCIWITNTSCLKIFLQEGLLGKIHPQFSTMNKFLLNENGT